MTWVDIEEDVGENVRDWFGVAISTVPAIRLYIPGSGDDFKKYKMDSKDEITKKNLYSFYNRYKRRKIKPYKKSEPVP